MNKFRCKSLLAGTLCCTGLAGAQVPLTGKIAYSSLPSPDGGRQWMSLGWNVRLLKEKSGWAWALVHKSTDRHFGKVAG